jgi:hypothetical protein
MAKAGRRPKQSKADSPGGETVSSYFRRVFAERPDLLNAGTNKEIYDRWLMDYPGYEEVPKRVRDILFNLKSVLRKKRRRRRTASVRAEEPLQAIVILLGPTLETLEEDIDQCLTRARALGRAGLENVIGSLRRARNEVVRLIGQ